VRGLLIDANLLVLFVVGSVNPDRIERFKAREHKFAVLTADFDLYRALSSDGIPVLNFAHLQQLSWGV
jgi:hypothetical protein